MHILLRKKVLAISWRKKMGWGWGMKGKNSLVLVELLLTSQVIAPPLHTTLAYTSQNGIQNYFMSMQYFHKSGSIA